MTLYANNSLAVSQSTIDLTLKAIKLSNRNTQKLKQTQQDREQKFILGIVFLLILNISTLALNQYSPDSGIVNANPIDPPDAGADKIDILLRDLEGIASQSTTQDGYSRPSSGKRVSALQSKIQPIVETKGLRTAAPADEMVRSYYGELLPRKDVIDAEQAGMAPHSNNMGDELGDPTASKNIRIDEIVRTRIPLSTQETLYLKKLVDDNERATFATPDVKQRTIKISYNEGKIPTITVAKNNIATLSFVDRFGNPFPISSLSPKGVGELFTTELISQEGTHSNVAEIRASKLNGSSNISVMLIGRTIPAVFKINLSQSLNDARTIVQLDSSAPGFEHVSLPAATSGLQICQEDLYMEAILQGVAPSDLERIETRVERVQAFSGDGFNYIRSAHQIVDPECTCRIYGVDNLNVCKQPNAVPSILYVDSINNEFGSLSLTDASQI